MTTTDILTTIDKRLDQARAEITRLEEARRALADGSARVADGSAPVVRRTSRRPPRRAARATQQIVPAGKLTALLGDSAGMSTSELAQATNGKPAQILALLRELEQNRQVRRTGQRRATRWHLITDEDRIAERAAEIAAQSKRVKRER